MILKKLRGQWRKYKKLKDRDKIEQLRIKLFRKGYYKEIDSLPNESNSDTHNDPTS